MADQIILTKDDVVYVNINDLIEKEQTENQKTGRLKEMLSGFVCSKNQDVEKFLKKSALNFTRQKFSVTYLVLAKETKKLLGYFALVTKPLCVPESDLDIFKKTLNHDQKHRLQSMCVPMVGSNLTEQADNESDHDWLLPVFLIAQLGKNDAGSPNQFAGSLLLELAMSAIRNAQRLVGGRIVLVEAEPSDKLLSFYIQNGFRTFKTRNFGDGKHLVQLLKIL